MDANIPGYAVIQRIGEGGMATVYLAYQQNLERRVALKVLQPSLAENPDFCERFMREAKIGASLSHRNIVPVYEAGCFKTWHYLAMEHLPNGDLKRLIAQGCDAGFALRVIYDIANALHYAHSKSCLHRDIKPENILFREDRTAVLTDFGVAVDLKAAALSGRHDRTIVGSPQYMSPEQARAEPLDVRSDIYSLGAVLFEALAGRPLLEEASSVADAVHHSDDPVPRLPADVSWLQPVLERMLAKDREERFADMDEVLRALEPCLNVPTSLLAGTRRRQRPATAPPEPPARPRRDSLDDLRAIDDFLLTPSAPTLVVNASDDLAAALASCPPVNSPLHVQPAPSSHRPWIGVGVLVLLLGAIPLTLQQWPSLLENLGSTAPARTAQLSGELQRESLVAEADSIQQEEPGFTRAGVKAEEVAVMTTDVDQAPVSTVADRVAMDDSSGEIAPASLESEEIPVSEPATVAAIDERSTESTEQALLQQADQSLQGAPPTQARLDDAYAKFREVLSRTPSNQEARDGLASVAHRYLEMASIALNNDELKSAQEYLDLASNIATRHRLGGHIKDKISDMQYVINRLHQLEFQPAPKPWQDAQVNWSE